VDYPPFALQVRHNDGLLFDINDAAGSEKHYFNPQRVQFSAKLTATVKINTQTIQLTDSSKILLTPCRKGGSSDLPIPAIREDNTTYSWNNIELHEPGFYWFKIQLTDVKDLRNQGTLMEIPYNTPILIEIYHQDVRFTLLPSQFITKNTRTWPFEIRMEVPDDINASRCLFQYKFPGENVSITGVCTGNPNRRDYVTLRNRDIMPALEKAQDGKMTFYLSLSGKNDGDSSVLPLHPEVIVEDSLLKCVEIKIARSQNNEIYTYKKGDLIEARAALNDNPRLENVWRIKGAKLYIFPSKKTCESGKQLSCYDIKTVIGNSRDKIDNYQQIPLDPNGLHKWHEISKYLIGDNKEDSGIVYAIEKWLSQITGISTILKKTKEYVIVASVNYLPSDITVQSENAREKTQVSEWTEACSIYVQIPYVIDLYSLICNLILLLVIILILYSIIVYFLKKKIMNPEDIGLRIRVDDEAEVEPNGGLRQIPVVSEKSLLQALREELYHQNSDSPPIIQRLYRMNYYLGFSIDFILLLRLSVFGRYLLPVKWSHFRISLAMQAEKKDVCFVYLKVCRNLSKSSIIVKAPSFKDKRLIPQSRDGFSIDIPLHFVKDGTKGILEIKLTIERN
jgi:hypothetical protein